MTSQKIPRKTFENYLSPVKESETIKDDYYRKVKQRFYDIKTKDHMKFEQIWHITNTKIEDKYIEVRSQFKKEFGQINEDYAFLYYPNIKYVSEMAAKGKIHTGNLTESKLGKVNMGVSLCRFSDIYHPGNLSGLIPKRGILVMVKVLKGKVNFVVCDNKPLEPQPKFNCHINKKQDFDSNTTIYNAFHASQIFVYEYDEDCNICSYPSQILPLLAVQFTWQGDYIFRPNAGVKNNKSSANKFTRPPASNLPSKLISIKNTVATQKRTTIHSREATYTIRNVIMMSKISFNFTIYLYLLKRITFPFLHQCPLIISNLIDSEVFLNELNQMRYFLHDKISPNTPINILKPIKLCPTEPFYLGTSDYHLSFKKLTNDDRECQKYMIYFRLVGDKSIKFVQLHELLHSTQALAHLVCDDAFKTQLYIFVDGSLSSSLGLERIQSDETYFHGIALIKDHPEFLYYNYSKDILKEQMVYFSTICGKSVSVLSSPSINSPASDYDLNSSIFQRTCRDQAEVQQQFYSQIVKSNLQPIHYKRLDMTDPENIPPIDSPCANNDNVSSSSMEIDPEPENIENIQLPNSPKPKKTIDPKISKKIKKQNKKHRIQKKLLDFMVNDNSRTEEPVLPDEDQEICTPHEEMQLEKHQESDMNEPVGIDDDFVIRRRPNRPIENSVNNKGTFKQMIFIEQQKFMVKGIRGHVLLDNGKTQCFNCPPRYWHLDSMKFAKVDGYPHLSLYTG